MKKQHVRKLKKTNKKIKSNNRSPGYYITHPITGVVAKYTIPNPPVLFDGTEESINEMIAYQILTGTQYGYTASAAFSDFRVEGIIRL